MKTHETVGIDAFRTLAQASAAMFSSAARTCCRSNSIPGQVIATIVFSGVLAVDMPDGPAKGSEVAMEGSSTFTFEEGKIRTVVDRS